MLDDRIGARQSVDGSADDAAGVTGAFANRVKSADAQCLSRGLIPRDADRSAGPCLRSGDQPILAGKCWELAVQ